MRRLPGRLRLVQVPQERRLSHLMVAHERNAVAIAQVLAKLAHRRLADKEAAGIVDPADVGEWVEDRR